MDVHKGTRIWTCRCRSYFEIATQPPGSTDPNAHQHIPGETQNLEAQVQEISEEMDDLGKELQKTTIEVKIVSEQISSSAREANSLVIDIDTPLEPLPKYISKMGSAAPGLNDERSSYLAIAPRSSGASAQFREQTGARIPSECQRNNFNDVCDAYSSRSKTLRSTTPEEMSISLLMACNDMCLLWKSIRPSARDQQPSAQMRARNGGKSDGEEGLVCRNWRSCRTSTSVHSCLIGRLWRRPHANCFTTVVGCTHSYLRECGLQCSGTLFEKKIILLQECSLQSDGTLNQKRKLLAVGVGISPDFILWWPTN